LKPQRNPAVRCTDLLGFCAENLTKRFLKIVLANTQAVAYLNTMKTKTTCGRCGGSGSYSFNLRDGTVCYGCNGSGFQMVDLAAVAKKKTAEAKRQAAANVGREAYIAAMASVRSEFNAAFGFDLTTLLGLDKLNTAVYRATGKDLVAHCKARNA
jgi:DnaJ-class molecular chaperone